MAVTATPVLLATGAAGGSHDGLLSAPQHTAVPVGAPVGTPAHMKARPAAGAGAGGTAPAEDGTPFAAAQLQQVQRPDHSSPAPGREDQGAHSPSASPSLSTPTAPCSSPVGWIRRLFSSNSKRQGGGSADDGPPAKVLRTSNSLDLGAAGAEAVMAAVPLGKEGATAMHLPAGEGTRGHEDVHTERPSVAPVRPPPPPEQQYAELYCSQLTHLHAQLGQTGGYASPAGAAGVQAPAGPSNLAALPRTDSESARSQLLRLLATLQSGAPTLAPDAARTRCDDVLREAFVMLDSQQEGGAVATATAATATAAGSVGGGASGPLLGSSTGQVAPSAPGVPASLATAAVAAPGGAPATAAAGGGSSAAARPVLLPELPQLVAQVLQADVWLHHGLPPAQGVCRSAVTEVMCKVQRKIESAAMGQAESGSDSIPTVEQLSRTSSQVLQVVGFEPALADGGALLQRVLLDVHGPMSGHSHVHALARCATAGKAEAKARMEQLLRHPGFAVTAAIAPAAAQLLLTLLRYGCVVG